MSIGNGCVRLIRQSVEVSLQHPVFFYRLTDRQREATLSMINDFVSSSFTEQRFANVVWYPPKCCECSIQDFGVPTSGDVGCVRLYC